jgi:hypothetical protein
MAVVDEPSKDRTPLLPTLQACEPEIAHFLIPLALKDDRNTVALFAAG